MTGYYNEIEPFAAQWLRNLIDAGHIAPGDVDERSIVDVQPADLVGYDQCHFFAGIGGWSLALRLAGWPDDRPVWTGSAPCQPFSAAGKRRGIDDPRHLWPTWHRLVSECRPATIFGEQVAGAAGRAWLDAVFADMEGDGYAVAAADLAAASVGAPHIRQRLYWCGVADAELHGHPAAENRRSAEAQSVEGGVLESARARAFAGGVADAASSRRDRSPQRGEREKEGLALLGKRGRLGHVGGEGLARRQGQRSDDGAQQPTAQRAGGATDFWADAEWLPCSDGTTRPVESGSFPLVARLPRKLGALRPWERRLAEVAGVSLDVASLRSAGRHRTGQLKGYGNAVVPPLAAEFVRAVIEESLQKSEGL